MFEEESKNSGTLSYPQVIMLQTELKSIVQFFPISYYFLYSYAYTHVYLMLLNEELSLTLKRLGKEERKSLSALET
jgi:hypothetical protein